ncbi:hypothetical protein [Stakelama saccharophila]|uniref:DUF4129 domain-containing protein n=1 Tax=Stakelama saccharophila TaxID=3075605 RepID=A0ABZ0BBL5_9SPHN|nr:hypothetical protein [Stakelama sp. W311]WNO54779.1 hypothetical protein RPR59_05910 [Stakelama sp. W311]
MAGPDSPAATAAASPPPAGAEPGSIAAAHHRLLADKSIQFDLPVRQTERHPPPQWLLDMLHGIESAARWVGDGWWWILGVVALGLAAILILTFFPPARHWWRNLRHGGAQAAEPDWTPDPGTARRLLEEADMLAARGCYAEAVHLILFRSIEDIERWRGEDLRPSLTSRDITRDPVLTDDARGIFSHLVAAVERSLFAGRPLLRGDWDAARRGYSDFALGGR